MGLDPLWIRSDTSLTPFRRPSRGEERLAGEVHRRAGSRKMGRLGRVGRRGRWGDADDGILDRINRIDRIIRQEGQEPIAGKGRRRDLCRAGSNT